MFFLSFCREWKNGVVKKTLLYTAFVFNVIAALSLLISCISVFIPPDVWWIPALFGLAYPYILLVNVLFIVLWLLVKPRNVFISLIIILPGWGLVRRTFQSASEQSDNPGIKVVSYNVQHFSGHTRPDQKKNAGKIVDFLEEQKADIICLQEVRLRQNSIFNLEQAVRSISTINHYQYARSSTTYGSVTMTRYPIVHMGEIRFKNTRNISIFTDVLVGKDTVRVFNIHLQSYHIDPGRYNVIDSPDITREEDLREIQEIGIKYKAAVKLRASQVREIRKYIRESPYPVIVCGDFNDTPVSFSYQKIRRGLNDAFMCSGSGAGRTYIRKNPALRIDYIFHSKSYTSVNFQTIPFYLSDHLPVACKLIKR